VVIRPTIEQMARPSPRSSGSPDEGSSREAGSAWLLG
jgi:hypothetical protein